jgi:hypothetical protein
MLFWLDAVHVTIAGAGVARDVGCQGQRIAGGSTNGNGNVGRSGRSDWQTLHDRRPSSTRVPPIICIAVLSARRPLPSATSTLRSLLTVPYKMHSDRTNMVGRVSSGWVSQIHALRLLGLGNAIDHRFACDITKDWKTIVFDNSRPRVRHF